MVGLFARMFPGGIVKETYQTLMSMPGVRDNLYDALKREGWGANIAQNSKDIERPAGRSEKYNSITGQGLKIPDKIQELRDKSGIENTYLLYNTLDKLWEQRFFRIGLRELLANVAKNMDASDLQISSLHTYQGSEELQKLHNPLYRRDVILPYIFHRSSKNILPNPEIIKIVGVVIEKAFGDEGYAQILLEKILRKGPYGRKRMHINKNISFLRDEQGNITAKRIGDELIQRVEELLINNASTSSSPHSTLSPQTQPE